MNNEIESKSLQRRILLMVLASAFLIWQVPGMDFLGKAVVENRTVAALIAGTGFVVWAGALIYLFATGRGASRRRDPHVASALEDELVQLNRSKAFSTGYWVTLLAAASLFLLSLFQPLTGNEAAHLILVIAVVTPIYAFVVLERSNA